MKKKLKQFYELLCHSNIDRSEVLLGFICVLAALVAICLVTYMYYFI